MDGRQYQPNLSSISLTTTPDHRGGSVGPLPWRTTPRRIGESRPGDLRSEDPGDCLMSRETNIDSLVKTRFEEAQRFSTSERYHMLGQYTEQRLYIVPRPGYVCSNSTCADFLRENQHCGWYKDGGSSNPHCRGIETRVLWPAKVRLLLRGNGNLMGKGVVYRRPGLTLP